MNRFFITLCLLLAIGFAGCMPIRNREAKAVFSKEHPNYTIVFAGAGEGHADAVYYHFEYKKPNDPEIYKEIWLFMRQDDGTWKVTNREKANE